MVVSIVGPLTSIDGLDALAPLGRGLHLHHLEVSSYGPLVGDVGESWQRRRVWYARLLGDGGAYFVARRRDEPLGYAFLHLMPGLDDTFEVTNGVVELITLVVAAGERGHGVGAALLQAVEGVARAHDIDTLKVSVMTGNDRARAFYGAAGFALAEEVLYRKLTM